MNCLAVAIANMKLKWQNQDITQIVVRRTGEMIGLKSGSVTSYTSMTLKYPVYFPAGMVPTCALCRYSYADSLKRARCRITDEVLYNYDRDLGDECPLVETEVE